jgi:hypothetical protein
MMMGWLVHTTGDVVPLILRPGHPSEDPGSAPDRPRVPTT